MECSDKASQKFERTSADSNGAFFGFRWHFNQFEQDTRLNQLVHMLESHDRFTQTILLGLSHKALHIANLTHISIYKYFLNIHF